MPSLSENFYYFVEFKYVTVLVSIIVLVQTIYPLLFVVSSPELYRAHKVKMEQNEAECHHRLQSKTKRLRFSHLII